MNRTSTIAAIGLALALSACQNEPDENADNIEAAIPIEDDTANAGDAGDSETGPADESAEGASGTMESGSSDGADMAPPEDSNSKLQKADPAG